MQIKIVHEDDKFHTYECRHIGVTKSPGRVEVELCPSGPTLALPDDGKVIYVINDNAKTTDTLRATPVEETS